jgi:hypothetical protein
MDDEKLIYDVYAWICHEEAYLSTIQKENKIKSAKNGAGYFAYGCKHRLMDFWQELFNKKLQLYEEARAYLKKCGKPKTPIDRLNIVLMRIQQAQNQEIGTCK